MKNKNPEKKKKNVKLGQKEQDVARSRGETIKREEEGKR
jgi:hypothetical protein